MTNHMSEVKQIEEHIKDLKRLVAKKEQALKLAKNRDFKELVLDGFCTTDAAKYVQQAGDPNLNTQEREDALAIALSAGHFKRYMAVICQMGSNAESQLERAEVELEDARQEDSQGDFD